jgi:diacylglycerol kinase (ATP)
MFFLGFLMSKSEFCRKMQLRDDSTKSCKSCPKFLLMSFNLRERAFSFRHAFRGIALVLRTQHNAWIHLVATAIVVIAGLLTGLTWIEWCVLVLAIGLVWTAEALNTAIEFLADEVSTEKRDLIGQAKDAAEAGVLLASIGAAMVGLIVFVPHWLVALEMR